MIALGWACPAGLLYIRRAADRSAENQLTQQDNLNPSASAMESCFVCKQVDTRVKLMTSESRGVLTRQLHVLAEDMQRIEARLAEDKPMFVHQDCLKPSKLSLSSELLDQPSER